MKALVEFTSIDIVPFVVAPPVPVTAKSAAVAPVNASDTFHGVFSASFTNVSDPAISTVEVLWAIPVPLEPLTTAKLLKVLSVS